MSAGRTPARPAEARGAGLFSGRPATVRFLPAAPGEGVTFRRTDLNGHPAIPARIDALCPDPARAGLPAALRARNTILASPAHPAALVLTTEHALSALAGLGVTDTVVELDGPELPIGDGSAAPFVEALLAAGLASHDGAPEPLVLDRDLTADDPASGASISASPRSEPGCEFVYELDYGPGAPIPAQRASIVLTPGEDGEAYARDVAPARTFCLAAEAQAMRAMGLFADLSPRDMLVLGPDGPIDNALRFENEPARHKLLDLIGDLALVGRPLRARIVARRSGHALNHALARLLAALGPTP